VSTTAAVGVDVDHLKHYYRIHGFDEGAATEAAWAVGVPRFIDLFAEVGIAGTFYCVAEDLQAPGTAQRMRMAVDAGHEIGNHSWHHRYDLIHMAPGERLAEVDEARKRLQDASGTAVEGFRAPGYNITADLLRDVVAAGHTYDSSHFPCVPYYTAKAAVMGMMRLRGRRSQSVLVPPAFLTGPRNPYRIDEDRPYRRGSGLQEYPISLAAGVPLIGTAFTALGRRASLAAVAVGLRLNRHLTLEFHAADLLSLKDDGLDPQLAVQPDLRVPLTKKRRIFRDVLKLVAQRATVRRLDQLSHS
jgi:peptidoglycan/xylan/chitin deacetylase (PgdA/CDA1 family)